jgi:hypothetical protein
MDSISSGQNVPHENFLMWSYQRIFPDNSMNLDQLSEFYEGDAGDELFEQIDNGHHESMLRMALILCMYEDEVFNAIELAEEATKGAQKEKINLGKFWFTYGVTLQWNEQFPEAMKAFGESLNAGFGAASLPLGQLTLINDANLKLAIAIWKSGVSEYGIHECEIELKKLEIDPGIYRAAVTLRDGTVDIITVLEKN